MEWPLVSRLTGNFGASKPFEKSNEIDPNAIDIFIKSLLLGERSEDSSTYQLTERNPQDRNVARNPETSLGISPTSAEQNHKDTTVVSNHRPYSIPDFMSNDHGISPSAAANSSSRSVDMGSTQTVGIQALLDDITGNHCDQLDIMNLNKSESDTSERNGPTATHLSPYETALNSGEHASSIHRQRRRYSAGQGQAPITPIERRKRRYSAEERFEVAERRLRPCLTDHKVRKVKV